MDWRKYYENISSNWKNIRIITDLVLLHIVAAVCVYIIIDTNSVEIIVSAFFILVLAIWGIIREIRRMAK